MRFAAACLILMVVLPAATPAIYTSNVYTRERFTGNYCKQQSRDICCDDRNDDCSMDISDRTGSSLCYCDEFCNQHLPVDCCPDYVVTCNETNPEPEPAPPVGKHTAITYSNIEYNILVYIIIIDFIIIKNVSIIISVSIIILIDISISISATLIIIGISINISTSIVLVAVVLASIIFCAAKLLLCFNV